MPEMKKEDRKKVMEGFLRGRKGDSGVDASGFFSKIIELFMLPGTIIGEAIAKKLQEGKEQKVPETEKKSNEATESLLSGSSPSDKKFPLYDAKSSGRNEGKNLAGIINDIPNLPEKKDKETPPIKEKFAQKSTQDLERELSTLKKLWANATPREKVRLRDETNEIADEIRRRKGGQ